MGCHSLLAPLPSRLCILSHVGLITSSHCRKTLSFSRWHNFRPVYMIADRFSSRYPFHVGQSHLLAQILNLLTMQISVHTIPSAINPKKFTIGIFFDLSKAFDTVNHNILFIKLKHYRLRGISHGLNVSLHKEQIFVQYWFKNNRLWGTTRCYPRSLVPPNLYKWFMSCF